MNPKILIVDDELSVRKSLQQLLSRGFSVSTADCGREAKKLYNKDVFDLMLLDILLPDCNGVDLLESLRTDFPELPVIMITGTKKIKTAVSAMKLGAFDYITKPFNSEELVSVINRALTLRKQQHEALKLFKRAQEEMFFGHIVGRSQKIIEVFKRIAQVMYTSTTVLIEGESGTGKELIAKAIHFHGIRRSNPFIPVNISSFSETLLESELFGHEKGAFTGAVQKKLGTLELADKGTLFLDEVGDIPASVQVKLLRVLQEREFRRVGGTKNIKVDVRYIAATNKNLSQMIAKRTFREDLYYRINVVPIRVPTLRERPEDIPVLIYHFVEKLKNKLDKKIKGFADESIRLFKKYNWPGNIRELENLVEQLILMTDGNWIKPQDLPVYIQKQIKMQRSLGENVSLFERKLIEDTLIKTGGIVNEAAKMLGTTRRILKYRIEKLGVTLPEK